jgi:hypothetical protein
MKAALTLRQRRADARILAERPKITGRLPSNLRRLRVKLDKLKRR